MSKRDFLSLNDFSGDELHAIVERAIELKRLRKNSENQQSLRGKVLAMIFEKASTRTRVSFEVGMFELGGHAVHLAATGSQIGRGEPIADTARVLSSYCDAILIRTFEHKRLEALAKHATVPVINGLTDTLHPCQLVADLQTVQERHGTMTGLRYAWIGDGNNMAHSWIHAASILGLDLILACPEGYQPDAEIVANALKGGKGSITLTVDPAKAAQGADVISTDVWASMGQEAESSARLARFSGFCVDQSLVERGSKDVTVLHCLPAHRGEEISAEVLEGPHSAVWQQAENRLHAQKAVLEILLR